MRFSKGVANPFPFKPFNLYNSVLTLDPPKGSLENIFVIVLNSLQVYPACETSAVNFCFHVPEDSSQVKFGSLCDFLRVLPIHLHLSRLISLIIMSKRFVENHCWLRKPLEL